MSVLDSYMAIDEWMSMCQHAQLIDHHGFGFREAALAFSWSRMQVIDERTAQSSVRAANLGFEDCAIDPSFPSFSHPPPPPTPQAPSPHLL